MVEIIRNILLVIYAIVCIALIILATMQTKDANGASGTITGSSSNNFYEQNKGRTKEGKLKRYTRQLKEGKITLTEIQRSIAGWLGYVKHADSYKLRKSMFYIEG